MADSPSPFSIDTVLETVKKTAETIANFVQWIAGLIRERKWSELISLILAVVILTWLSRAAIAQFVNEQASQWFLWICLAVGLLLLLAVILAVLNKPSQPSAAPFVERKAIKGLRPFTAADAEIFSRLQRNQDLGDCLNALGNPTFRFGHLVGESGCGKTSFLQAGLLPKLTAETSSEHGVYIRFSDRNPLETVYQVLIEQLRLDPPQPPFLRGELDPLVSLTPLSKGGSRGDQETEGRLKEKNESFIALLSRAAESKPLILLFDQFEQFFVHCKLKEDREPFIHALTQWYRNAETLPVKIVFSIRADLYYNLIEIEKALNYSPSPFEVFRLEKFSPQQATDILGVIAETEQFDFDRPFIRKVAQQELASREDGLISPVDLQILAWMIQRENTDERQAFNEKAFQKFGGIEGLLKRYLEKTLETRTTTTQKQAAIKVLLALTDLERQVRAGMLTVEELQATLKDTVKPEEVAEATTWLARGDVRLISPTEREGVIGYELAHERIIPALMQLSGKELTEANRANKLLDTRVNEWLGSNCSSRYLFYFRELRLIERQKPYLIWGTKRQQKERLIAQSKRKLYRIVGVVGAIVLLLVGGWSWLNYTPWGHLWQVRRDLDYWSQRVGDYYQAQAVVAFAKDGDFTQASKLVEKIDDFRYKAPASSAIAQAYAKLNQIDKAVPLLEKALVIAEKIEDSYPKSIASSTKMIKPFPCSKKPLPVLRRLRVPRSKPLP